MQNPWKEEKVLDIDIRCQIIFQSCFEVWDNYEMSTIEKYLTPPYYSYATLHALKNKYCNDEIFVLCGEDTIKDIPNWMNGGAIIKDYNFLIVGRPKGSISSSEIRDIVRNRKRNVDELLREYVNENVINLIKNYYK